MRTTAEIADAVVAQLDAEPLPLPIRPRRTALPLATLEETAALQVSVVPTGLTCIPIARTRMQHEHRVDVIVQQRLADDDRAAIDPLLGLVQAIAAALSLRSLAHAPEARWVRTEHSPLLALDHLHELRQFTSLIALAYRTWED